MIFDYERIIATLEQTFLSQDKFVFDKYVPEFTYEGKFLGDCFIQTVVEPLGKNPPRFYHNFSPFDVISNKAPEQAMVLENGELLLSMDFTQYVVLRTAAMNAVLLKGLGIDSLNSKRVLLFGAGKIATETVKILSSQLGLSTIDIITKSGDLTKIKNAVNNVTVNAGSLENISDYDVIICHTQSAASVISAEHISKLKQGAILASFISSTEHGELPDSVYDARKANIIIDWAQTIAGAKDMQRAQKTGLFTINDTITIKDLLDSKKVDQTKKYTVYRSTGTPIQNLAVLKELLSGSPLRKRVDSLL
jgi:ornithine cyclodeaminase/alanine dehydrogenase-like protein (mu-crystallin family)